MAALWSRSSTDFFLLLPVQWSTRPDFSIITGETEILDLSKPNCSIDLTQGRKYFFRASCGNLKGFGAFITSIPNSVIPSCWREVNMKKSRSVESPRNYFQQDFHYDNTFCAGSKAD